MMQRLPRIVSGLANEAPARHRQNAPAQPILRAVKVQILNPKRLFHFRRFLREDPGITYDLFAEFGTDPEKKDPVKEQMAEIEKIPHHMRTRQQINKLRKLKNRKFCEGGEIQGLRVTNRQVPLRVRERLVAEGMRKPVQFLIGRYGMGRGMIKSIRKAFQTDEILRLQVQPPWKDNMKEMAKRIEDRTGAVILDRAGGRVFLYRGFTDADLARNGLLGRYAFNDEENAFTTPIETDLEEEEEELESLNGIEDELIGEEMDSLDEDKDDYDPGSIVDEDFDDDDDDVEVYRGETEEEKLFPESKGWHNLDSEKTPETSNKPRKNPQDKLFPASKGWRPLSEVGMESGARSYSTSSAAENIDLDDVNRVDDADDVFGKEWEVRNDADADDLDGNYYEEDTANDDEDQDDDDEVDVGQFFSPQQEAALAKVDEILKEMEAQKLPVNVSRRRKRRRMWVDHEIQ